MSVVSRTFRARSQLERRNWGKLRDRLKKLKGF